MDTREPAHILASRHRRILGLSLILFACTNGMLLFSKSVMWDSWIWIRLLHQGDLTQLYYIFDQSRLFHTLYTYVYLDAIGDVVFLSKLITFVSWIISGLCLHLIVQKKELLSPRDSFFLTSTFLLIPTFFVKHDLSVLFYSISNTGFFIGAYLYLCKIPTLRDAFLRYTNLLLTGICFSVAFLTNSFLPFFGGIILYVVARDIHHNMQDGTPFSISLTWATCLKHSTLCVFPITFFVLQQIFIGNPFGISADYNQIIRPGIRIEDFMSMFMTDTWNFVAFGFGWPIMESIAILQRKYFFVLFIIVTTLLWWARRHILREHQYKKSALPFAHYIYLLAGMSLFFLGAISYLLVHKSPHPFASGFDMRMALLLPLPSALLLMSSINILAKERWQTFIQSVFLSLFITCTLYNYYSVDMDYYKQVAIIQTIKHHDDEILPAIGTDSVVVFDDRLTDYNWTWRSILSHEYTGYLYEALQKDIPTLSIVKYNEYARATTVHSSADLTRLLHLHQREIIYLSFHGATPNPTIHNAVFLKIDSPAVIEPTVGNWLRLTYKRVTSSDIEFATYLEKTLQIEATIQPPLL